MIYTLNKREKKEGVPYSFSSYEPYNYDKIAKEKRAECVTCVRLENGN